MHHDETYSLHFPIFNTILSYCVFIAHSIKSFHKPFIIGISVKIERKWMEVLYALRAVLVFGVFIGFDSHAQKSASVNGMRHCHKVLILLKMFLRCFFCCDTLDENIIHSMLTCVVALVKLSLLGEIFTFWDCDNLCLVKITYITSCTLHLTLHLRVIILWHNIKKCPTLKNLSSIRTFYLEELKVKSLAFFIKKTGFEFCALAI